MALLNCGFNITLSLETPSRRGIRRGIGRFAASSCGTSPSLFSPFAFFGSQASDASPPVSDTSAAELQNLFSSSLAAAEPLDCSPGDAAEGGSDSDEFALNFDSVG